MQHNTICCLNLLCSILEKTSIQKLPDGVRSFCEPNIHICCKRIVPFLRNTFEFFGHSQLLEICATSKEVVLFHDNAFVLLRFAGSCN